MTTATSFDTKSSTKGLGYAMPHKMGRALWAPMWLMALMAFAVGFVLAIARASIIADFGVADPGAQRLNHLVPAFMFIGFAAVFAAVSFAVARILGAFRKGGGEIQESVGDDVKTVKMPVTARVFMAMMMMGMMLIIVMVALHFVAAGNAGTWTTESLEAWARSLEGFRRLGIAMYLFGIAFGLGTIITVLRFQSIRIRELAHV
ncbi:MAG: hypothetical protein GY720_21455 [bacterium]|nr:hypothetical protein [bacterium]